MVGFETRDGFAIPTGIAQSDSQRSLKPENFKFWSARSAPMTPFASLSASILGNLGKPGSSGGRVEPATGYEFPAELCYLKKPCPSLAGLG